ncbi:DUF2509 family protein [Hafnia sp. CBA7124]|uniref:DUF2509 family protein n=1 Tax=Hafnia sp. CBA7124 TaxID=1848580 RepID=UPI000BBAC739|nr:DUF2509 family protein [Hafnia sp. CBA7124]
MNLAYSHDNPQAGSMLLPSVLLMLSLSLLVVGAQQGRLELQVQNLGYQRQLKMLRQQAASALDLATISDKWPAPLTDVCQTSAQATVCFKAISTDIGILCAVVKAKIYGMKIQRFSYVSMGSSVNTPSILPATTRMLTLSGGWFDYPSADSENLC